MSELELDPPDERDMPDVHSVWVTWTGDLDDIRDLRPDWVGLDPFQLRGALERALDFVNDNFFTPPGEGDSAI